MASVSVSVPPELAMLGKTLLNLDQVGQALDPNFDPDGAIRQHAPELLRKRMAAGFSPGNVVSGLLEMRDFAQRLPGRVNKILDRVANNDLEIRVQAIDEQRLMAGLQKMAGVGWRRHDAATVPTARSSSEPGACL